MKLTNKTMLLSATILTMTAATASANDSLDIPGEFDSYTTFVSNYVFRGITQSDEGAAIQGGIDWSHESGAYAGVWGSSVDFNDDTDFELDLFVGYGDQITDELSYDTSIIYYAYPGAPSGTDYDFIEFYGALAYDFDVASVSTSVNYSPDNYNGTGDATYFAVSADVPLENGFSLSGHVGHQSIDDEVKFGTPDYVDYGLSVNYEYDNFAFTLAYTDTDIDAGECFGADDGCSAQISLGVSASF